MLSSSPAGTALAGAGAGVIATAVMSVPMLVAGERGDMGEQPPKRVVRTVLGLAGDRDSSEATQDLGAAVAHVAFGAGGGAAFALLHRALHLPLPATVQGVAFGLGVWASSYKGWIPALGALPDADDDRAGRRRTMIGAHVVYGAVLGALNGRRGRRSPSSGD
ncbi:MAG: hypothetical protein KY447_00285 [Actinobacteria bacterium]|nr:hypothetical protein [Actinomycetota bacterium]